MSTGFARLASAGRSSASCARVSAQLRQLRPAASQASAERIPGPPALVTIATRVRAAAAASRQRRDVEQLLDRLGADHAGLAEERVDGRVRAGERGRVRARRPRPGLGRAALDRDDRLLARDAAGDPREPARIPERLEVEHDQSGARGPPPSTRGGRCPRRPPCCRRDERREADAALGRVPRSARPSAPLWDEKPMRPGRQRARPKVAFSDGPGRRSRGSWGRRVGRRARARERAACSWRSRPSSPISAKPAEMTQSARTPREERPRPPRRRAPPGGRSSRGRRSPGARRSSVYARTPATARRFELTG